MLDQEALLAEPADHYMNAAQQAFFSDLLHTQRHALQAQIDEQMAFLQDMETESDPADIGAAEEQRNWHLRLLEREKKLLDKIDAALLRLARGEYGWCAETGEPIGLKRLLLRPTASLCIEAKERQEKREQHMIKHRGE